MTAKRRQPLQVMFTAPRKAELRPVELGPLAPGDVRAATIASGISHGTEMTVYRGEAPHLSKTLDRRLGLWLDNAPGVPVYPRATGYDNVAHVLEAGEGVAGMKPGDIIWSLSPHAEVWQGNAESTFACRLPEGMSAGRGIYTALGVVALIAVHDAEIKVGDNVAVFGGGVIGQIIVRLAVLSGAGNVFLVDPVGQRREFGRKSGASAVLDPGAVDPGKVISESLDGGADVVIECTGRYDALHQAIRSARPCGTVVCAGLLAGKSDVLALSEEWHHNRITLKSSMGHKCPSRFHPLWDWKRSRDTVMGLLASGRLAVDDFPVREFAFEEAPAAYDFIDKHPEKVLRVSFSYSGDFRRKGAHLQERLREEQHGKS